MKAAARVEETEVNDGRVGVRAEREEVVAVREEVRPEYKMPKR